MHTFCALKTQPKLYHFQIVKASPKSSHHEDFGNVITFGWFGGGCSVLIVQKLAILADLITTF